MVTFSWTRLAAAAGGLAVSVIAGAGIASADPDLGPIVSSNCSYDQAVAAINAQYPDDPAQFNASPIAQGFLRQFADSPPDQRRQLAGHIQGMTDAHPYLETMKQVA